MLSPVHFRAQSSKLPSPSNSLIPVLYPPIAMAPVSDSGKSIVGVALVRSANLVNGRSLVFRNILVRDSTEEVLGVDERVADKVRGPHHRDESV